MPKKREKNKNGDKKKQIWLPKSKKKEKKDGKNRKSIEEDDKKLQREKDGRANLKYLKNG